MSSIPKLIFWFNTFPLKIPTRLFFFFFCKNMINWFCNLYGGTKGQEEPEEVICISGNQMTHNDMKKCSISLVLKCKLKAQWDITSPPSDGQKLKKKKQTMPDFRVWKNKDTQKLVKIKMGAITSGASSASPSTAG